MVAKQRLIFGVLALFVAALPPALAQSSCSDGRHVSGVVADSTDAMIIDALVTLDGRQSTKTDDKGHFAFRCIPPGRHSLHITANSFAARDMNIMIRTPEPPQVFVKLEPSTVETRVDIGEGDSALDDQGDAGSQTLSERDIVNLADDPDDLLRQLQMYAAGGGGLPGSAIVAIDGFRMDSHMPPKGSISAIKINPDVFSAEYAEPPYMGGRIEVYTRSGQDRFHGDLFLTSSNTFMNAKDPFSLSRAALGKRRYGFDLSGPLHGKTSDFALSLEHRAIDDFSVVNATTLDAKGMAVQTIQNVPTPQRLWMASARVGWQTSPRNSLTATYIANVNQLHNLGVGGTTLNEAGYDSAQSEHTVRATDIFTINPKLLHEMRIGIRWRIRRDIPHSTAPQLQVAGAFTSGGALSQNQATREAAVEFNDDIVLNTHKHLVKAGIQVNDFIENQIIPQNFNGVYIFGGGLAPELDANGNPAGDREIQINGLEEYRRSLLGLPGGTATAYTVTAGTPIIRFYQLRNVLFIQDDWKLRHNLTLASGLRYSTQTVPTTFGNIGPRIGLSWSPDKKEQWVLRAHFGVFPTPLKSDMYSIQQQMDGQTRVTSTIYLPHYGNPFLDATPIRTKRSYAPSLHQPIILEEHVSVQRELPHRWTAQASMFLMQIRNAARTLNVNSPLNNSPTGPRPISSNLNLLQYQESGHAKGPVIITTIRQSSYKRFQLYVGYIYVGIKGNVDSDPSSSPQSSRTDAGENARQSNRNTHAIIGSGQVELPGHIQLAGTLDTASGAPYNVLTGSDNNGDGIFNDRPEYAAPGTPHAVPTSFGLLTASGGIGIFPRNAGTMPWTIHLDMNLSRKFVLDRNATPEHQQSLSINLRSANILNHTNVTSVGNILGSSLFGRPYASESGRRLEIGLRYTF